MSEFRGYDPSIEDRGYLRSLFNESRVLAMRGTYNEVRLDPRIVIQVENQSSQGACAGHSLSSITEWIYRIITGELKTELSRAMAYYETQRIDRINGDSGSTIAGGVKLAISVGLCREELWKYPSRYDNRRPSNYDDILKDASNYKIGTSTRITSYEGYRTFLGAGLGGIHQGINWNSSMELKVVEQFRPTSRDGGHSIAGLCLSERVDSQGLPYVWILNSWSKSFGQNGWQEWSPTAIQQMLSHQNTAMVGLSDMPNMVPREYTLDDLKKDLRI